MLCLLDSEWASNPGAALTAIANREAKTKVAVNILAFLPARICKELEEKVYGEIYMF